MPETVNRDGFPKSGNFLAFLKMFTSLDKTKRKNVFISTSETPGLFHYCCFPTPVSLPIGSERFLQAAETIADIMSETRELLVPPPQP